MTDAPERVWIDRGPKGKWMYRPKKVYDSEHNYIRADLHQQALAEAEAWGYARAVEDAVRKVGFLRDQDDDVVWMTAIGEATEVIRALAQKEGE